MVNVPLNFGGQQRFLLLDSNALMHRAYYALPRLTDKEGKATNAIYGFLACLFKILQEQSPQYVAAVFDSPGKTFRHQVYPQYKATRIKAPDEFYAQFSPTKEILRLLNIPVLEKVGYEADDIIGAIAEKITDSQIKILILTGDFDLLQLVNARVNVLLLKKGVSRTIFYNEEKTREKLEGLSPEKIIDFKGLAGDNSDNIPGVPGVGPKTAFRLLRKFGSLENIYQQLKEGRADVKLSLEKKLREFQNQAFLSKRLATLKTDIPLDFSLAKWEQRGYNRKKVQKVLTELGFKSLLSRLP